MKKIFLVLAIMVLVFAGYHFFTGEYLGEEYLGGGTGTGGNNNINNGSSSNKMRLIHEGKIYEEYMTFDPFHPSNNKSYSEFEYVGMTTQYGTYEKYQYFMKINGYYCLVSLPGSTDFTMPTDYNSFLNFDWDTYYVTGTPLSFFFYVFGLDLFSVSTNYVVLSSYFSSENSYISTIDLLNYDIQNGVLEHSLFSSNVDYYVSKIIDSGVGSGDNAFFNSFSFQFGFYSWSKHTNTPFGMILKEVNSNNNPTYSLKNKNVEKQSFEIFDEYIPTSEENEYVWSEIIWSNSGGLTNAGHNSEDGWGDLYG